MSLSAQDPIVHLVRPRNGYNCPRNFHRLSRSLEKKKKERNKVVQEQLAKMNPRMSKAAAMSAIVSFPSK